MNAAQRAVASLPRRLGLGGQPFALYLGASLVSVWFLIALFAGLYPVLSYLKAKLDEEG